MSDKRFSFARPNWKEDAMSSTFLTSSDMNMIGGLIVEGRRRYPERSLAFFSEPARLLVKSFQAGVTCESELRRVMEDCLRVAVIPDGSIDRWDDEGGALPRMAA
jgi:hypothetical protein